MLTCAVVFGIEVLFVTFVHVKFAALYALLIGVPLVNAIVTINVGADATGTLPTAAARLERFVERTWAIIVIDVAITLVGQIGFDTASAPDAGDILLGVLVLFLAAMLVYAEPFAALEKDVQTLTVVPFAFLRSMMLCWVNMPRILSLFMIQIAVTIVQLELAQFSARAGTQTVMLVTLAYVTVASAPLAALFTVAYLDTAAQERRSQEDRR